MGTDTGEGFMNNGVCPSCGGQTTKGAIYNSESGNIMEENERCNSCDWMQTSRQVINRVTCPDCGSEIEWREHPDRITTDDSMIYIVRIFYCPKCGCIDQTRTYIV
jgi:predicted RNA-binding Zn-ribbon protein involved in translation (DUF1610 family)